MSTNGEDPQAEGWLRAPSLAAPPPWSDEYPDYLERRETERRRLRAVADGIEPAALSTPAHPDPLGPAETRSLLGDIHSARPDGGLGGMFISARDLAGMAPETPVRAVGRYVLVGAITELTGSAKRAGKTTMAAHMTRARLDGGTWLGERVTPAAVVYLSEQTPTSLRSTFDRAGLLDYADLRILLWRDARAARWAEIVEAAVCEYRRTEAGLLVVDTLPQFAGLRGDAENDAGPALEALAPLQAAAADGAAILLVRHDRKGGGEVGESARGSSAYTGAVDIVMQLRRPEKAKRPTIRQLLALSRFDETPAEVMVELTPDGYIALGTAEAVAVEEAKLAILGHLGDVDSATRAELEALPDLERTTCQRAIRELTEARLLVRSGRGVKGDPHRFARSDSGFVFRPPIGGLGGKRIPPEGVEADYPTSAWDS